MARIVSIIKHGNGFCCLETRCLFKYECANHTTAGEFRAEDGFSPDIIALSEGQASCDTIDRELDTEITYSVFPRNYDLLNRGAKTWSEIQE